MEEDEVLLISDGGKKNDDKKDRGENVSAYCFQSYQPLRCFISDHSAKRSLCHIRYQYIISACEKKPIIKVWRFDKNEPYKSIYVPGEISCLTVSHCGNYCYAAIQNTSIYAWKMSSGRLLNIVSGHHTKTITCLRASADNEYLVSSSEDGSVIVWLLKGFVLPDTVVKPYYTRVDHQSVVTDMHIAGFGKRGRLVTVSIDCTCRVYELDTGSKLLTISTDFPITAVTMDELEFFVVLGSDCGTIHKINLFKVEEKEINLSETNSRGITAKTGKGKEITCLTVSASGSYVVSGSLDGEVKKWDMLNLTLMDTIVRPGPITNILLDFFKPRFNNEVKFQPDIQIANFARQPMNENEDNLLEANLQTMIPSTKLDLFHLGTPDEYFDSRILVCCKESLEEIERKHCFKKSMCAGTNIFSARASTSHK